MEIGQKITRPYPFTKDNFLSGFRGSEGIEDYWCLGARKEEECDGSGYGYSVTYWADAEGEVTFEILAIVEMPRKMKTRVLFKREFKHPDGKVTKHSEVKVSSLDSFKKMLAKDKPYWDYELEG
ncbi:hypothetical protein JQC92_02525 [Shewanella sp. 202IG2-18]|uniref:hypothetical protein n=1 Tax=Parashewanella hymeniacidonis TaxID=2807618 RepID=UPI0019616FD3|nr:hypothetical protein [Parashewanella hymeniacidonis]MBM7070917.1 hypothetical protein [Parashewanella hymeniacidonis]